MSEARALAADLGNATRDVYRKAEASTKKAAHNIKTTMQEDAQSSGSYKHFADSITYDRAMSLGTIGYEIGPDKGRMQGALGNILYFGGARGGKVLDVEVGLRAEAPSFEKHMQDLAEEAFRG